MAKILGFEIKNVKQFKDHDGFTMYQGNVYLNGKKLGQWSQDSFGGADWYEFDERPYNAALGAIELPDDEMFDECRAFGLSLNMDILMEELVNLREDEKMYKKFAKQGFDKMMRFLHATRCCFAGVRDGEATDKVTEQVARQMGVAAGALKTKMFDADSFVVGTPIKVGA